MPKFLKVKYIVSDTGCWLWQGCTRGGYGMMNNPHYNGIGKKMLQAHRVYYEEKYGTIPVTMVLDHLCHNRLCVNPEHMEITTHKTNIRRGDLPIITKDIADKIREDYKNGVKQTDLAIKYGISQPTISQVVRGVTWV